MYIAHAGHKHPEETSSTVMNEQLVLGVAVAAVVLLVLVVTATLNALAKRQKSKK